MSDLVKRYQELNQKKILATARAADLEKELKSNTDEIKALLAQAGVSKISELETQINSLTTDVSKAIKSAEDLLGPEIVQKTASEEF